MKCPETVEIGGVEYDCQRTGPHRSHQHRKRGAVTGAHIVIKWKQPAQPRMKGIA